MNAAATLRGRFAPAHTDRVVVLCYHSVHDRIPFASVSPAMFAQHLGWLRDRCDVIPFRDVPQAAISPGRGRPRVAITFDDGYADNHHHALPLLLEYGLVASFYATVGLVDGDPEVVDRFATVRRTPRADVAAMSWPELRELCDAGMEVGSHMMTHRNLHKLDREALDFELRGSRERLEDGLGRRVTTLCYPFGKPRRHLGVETTERAAAAGYEIGGAVVPRAVRASDSPFVIPRFNVSGCTVPVLAGVVAGAWDVMGHAQEAMPMPVARLVSPMDFTF